MGTRRKREGDRVTPSIAEDNESGEYPAAFSVVICHFPVFFFPLESSTTPQYQS